MKSIDDLSPETQAYMDLIGVVDITVNGDTVKGWNDGEKFYLTPNELRKLAKACIDVAGYMEASA